MVIWGNTAKCLMSALGFSQTLTSTSLRRRQARASQSHQMSHQMSRPEPGLKSLLTSCPAQPCGQLLSLCRPLLFVLRYRVRPHWCPSPQRPSSSLNQQTFVSLRLRGLPAGKASSLGEISAATRRSFRSRGGTTSSPRRSSGDVARCAGSCTSPSSGVSCSHS